RLNGSSRPGQPSDGATTSPVGGDCLPLGIVLPGKRRRRCVDNIEDRERLRGIYGPPSERSLKKELTRLDQHCREFIARSPFLVIASSDPAGRCDASPKGDARAFVEVVGDHTLLIPDRLGRLLGCRSETAPTTRASQRGLTLGASSARVPA